MPIISQQKKDKISEHILSLLFENYPKPLFTSHIAKEIARDEEFTKKILQDMVSKDLVSSINKNNQGINYLKRIKWKISNKAHQAYSTHFK